MNDEREKQEMTHFIEGFGIGAGFALTIFLLALGLFIPIAILIAILDKGGK